MAIALWIALGALTGLLSGLFGVGGGFVLVPLLTVTGHALPVAIGTSLVYVALIGLGGAIAHWRARNLDLRFIAALALPAIAGAQVGALLSSRCADWLLAGAFAVFLLAVVTSLARPQALPVGEPVAPALAPTMGVGVATGVLSGLFGVGGGLVLVPAQVRLFNIPIRRAVGNSLAAIVLTGLSGVVTHTALGHVDWRASLALVPGGFLGMQAGTWLLRRLPASRLKRLLMAFMLVMAGYMGYRSYVLADHRPATTAPARTSAVPVT